MHGAATRMKCLSLRSLHLTLNLGITCSSTTKAFIAFRVGRVKLHTVIVCHLICLLHAAAIPSEKVEVFYVLISNPVLQHRSDPWSPTT
jgi:hypothetical protein